MRVQQLTGVSHSELLKFNSLALDALESNDLEFAQDCLNQAYHNSQPATELRVMTVNNLACLYKTLNEPERALLFLYESLEITSNSLARAATHLNICVIHSKLQSHKIALSHALKALERLENTPNTEILLVAYNNAANQWEFLGEWRKAAALYLAGWKRAATFVGKQSPVAVSLLEGLRSCQHKLQAKKEPSPYTQKLPVFTPIHNSHKRGNPPKHTPVKSLQKSTKDLSELCSSERLEYRLAVKREWRRPQDKIVNIQTKHDFILKKYLRKELTCIQRVWRGWLCRRKNLVKQRKNRLVHIQAWIRHLISVNTLLLKQKQQVVVRAAKMFLAQKLGNTLRSKQLIQSKVLTFIFQQTIRKHIFVSTIQWKVKQYFACSVVKQKKELTLKIRSGIQRGLSLIRLEILRQVLMISATKIQHSFRKYLALKKLFSQKVLLDRSSKTLQQVLRRQIARKCVSSVANKLTELQVMFASIYRKFVAAVKVRHHFTHLKIISITIQTQWKAYLACNTAKQCEVSMDYFARIIQQQWRSFTAFIEYRHYLERTTHQTLVIQRKTRQFLCLNTQLYRCTQVVIVQTLCRKVLAQDTIKILQKEHSLFSYLERVCLRVCAKEKATNLQSALCLASLQIQTQYRSFQARLFTKHRLYSNIKAALTIQQRLKKPTPPTQPPPKLQARRVKISPILAKVILVQRFIRNSLANRRRQKYSKPVLKLQTCLRMFIVQQHIRETFAVLDIELAVKQYLAKQIVKQLT